MALDEPKAADKTFEIDSLKFVVDAGLLESLGGVTIDHVNDGYRSGLTITSERPITGQQSGGCGGGSCSSC